MPIIVYVFLLILLLILFVLFTAIGFTFKLELFSLEKKKELAGIFTVKWLLFSHTFSIKEPKPKEIVCEEPDESQMESFPVIEAGKSGELRQEADLGYSENSDEDLLKRESKIQEDKSREIGEKKPEEKMVIIEDKEKVEFKEKTQDKEEIGFLERIRGRKKVEKEDKPEPEMEMTPREMLHWGLEAFKSLRKPLFRLFSDLLNGMKIKHLDSCLIFGLSDPADTGMLCGFIHAITGLIYSRCKHCRFSINPRFMDPVLDFRGNAEIRIRIHSLIFPFIKFILNGKTISFTYSIVKEILHRKWKSNWNSKWKSKWNSKWKSNS
jgi:hypothetical protein